MVKFFVPAANDREHSQEVYEKIRQFVAAPHQERRISSLSWRHNGMQMQCYVGGHLPGHYRTGDEPVCAIFDCDNLYKICTTNRGVLRGEPVYAGKDEHSQVSYFEAD